METFARMTNSTEGMLYLALMALSVIPFIIAVWRIFTGVSLRRSFFFWVGLAHCLWFVGVLSLIYDGTPPANRPVTNYHIVGLLWLVFFSWLIYWYTKDSPASNEKRHKKLIAVIGGGFLALVLSGTVFFLTMGVFIFGDSYLIKSGEKAWLTEREVRSAIGISSMPLFEYDKALSRSGFSPDWTEQNHWGKFKDKPSRRFYEMVRKKCKKADSGWEERTFENDVKEFSYNGSVKVKDEKFDIYVSFAEGKDSLRVCIVNQYGQ